MQYHKMEQSLYNEENDTQKVTVIKLYAGAKVQQ